MTGLLEGKSWRSSPASRIGDRSRGRWRRSSPRRARSSAFAYQGARIESSVRDLAASIGSDLCVECDVTDDASIASRVRAGRRGPRRRARPARPLDRLRPGARSRRALHRHGARRLPARAQHLESNRGGDYAACLATHARARRRRRRHDDVPLRRAGGAALQRDGCGEGRALTRACATSRPSLARPTSALNAISAGPGPERSRRVRSRGSRRWSRSSRGARADEAHDRRLGRRLGRALPAVSDGAVRHRHRPLRGRRLPRDGT